MASAMPLALHGNADSLLFGELAGLFITGIGMSRDADAGVVGQDALDALGHGVCAIGHGYLSGVLRVADSNAATIVDRYPGCAACGVKHGVEQRPIGHGVTAIFHGFGFAKRRGHGSAVEMISSNDDWSLDLAPLHQVVDGEAKLRALAVSQPADARRQTLKVDAFAGQVDPAIEDAILGKQFEYQLVGGGDVGVVSGTREPAERCW